MIEQVRLLTLKAAFMMDTVGNKGARGEIAMIKVVAPNVACRVIDWAIQAHGAGGVCDDFPLAYAYSLARTLRLSDGPDEVHRNAILSLRFRGFGGLAKAGLLPFYSVVRLPGGGITFFAAARKVIKECSFSTLAIGLDVPASHELCANATLPSLLHRWLSCVAKPKRTYCRITTKRCRVQKRFGGSLPVSFDDRHRPRSRPE